MTITELCSIIQEAVLYAIWLYTELEVETEKFIELAFLSKYALESIIKSNFPSHPWFQEPHLSPQKQSWFTISFSRDILGT